MSTLTRAVFDGEAILSLDDAKAHLRVRHDDEDALIEALRDAAVDWVETYCGVALSRREFSWRPSLEIRWRPRLPVRPVHSITAVGYIDAAGVPQGVDPARYILADDALLFLEGAPTPDMLSASITFTAGFDDALAEAPTLIAAVKMLLANLYRNREATVSGTVIAEVPLGVTALCRAWRTPVIG